MEEQEPQSVTPIPRIGALKNARHIRDELAKVYRDCRRGKLSTQDGSRLAFILAALHRMVAGAELEQRMTAIETYLAGGGTPDNGSNHDQTHPH